MNPKYRRIVLKLSGEAMAGGQGIGIDIETVRAIASQIKAIHDMGVETSVVIGGEIGRASCRERV